jgi:hypothetical protein
LFIDALADYTIITGTDLSKDPKFKRPSSAEALLQLLQEKEKAFKEYRDTNPRLIIYLTPVVNILWASSQVLSKEVNQVSESKAT